MIINCHASIYPDKVAKPSGRINLYYPTRSKMGLWSASKEAIWKEALKGDKESEDLVAKIKSVIAQK
jgi:hypothetical protein